MKVDFLTKDNEPKGVDYLILSGTSKGTLMKIKTEIIINASKERVWDILTDFGNYNNWNPFIIQSQGQAVVGTKLTNTMKNGDKNITFKPTILNVETYRYFDWLGKLWFNGLFDGHHYFEIEEINPNQVKLNHGENFSGILSSMILNKIGEQTRQNFVRMNMALKERAEG